jgi:hypothetical protein
MSLIEPEHRYDHERSDWNLRYVVRGVVALVVSGIVILAGTWWVFLEFYSASSSLKTGAAPITKAERIQAEPALQIAPQAEWTDMRAKEESILNSYSWVDRSRGVVHIPIERAMERIAQGRASTENPKGGPGQ